MTSSLLCLVLIGGAVQTGPDAVTLDLIQCKEVKQVTLTLDEYKQLNELPLSI